MYGNIIMSIDQIH